MKDIIKAIKTITKNNNIKSSKTFEMYNTIDVYRVDKINPSKQLKLHGYKMKSESHRYQLFNRDENKCVCCGTKASFWALQVGKKDKRGVPHLNLYGVDRNDKIILFTKDHILPRSLGGEDVLENYQIMCQKCNSKKDNDVDWNALGIEAYNYSVNVELIDGKANIIKHETVVVRANNESNAKGIACKLTRERAKGCNRSLPLSIALI